MKTKIFENLNLNNFNTKVVPEAQIEVSHIGLSKKYAFQAYNGQKYYFFNDFSLKTYSIFRVHCIERSSEKSYMVDL